MVEEKTITFINTCSGGLSHLFLPTYPRPISISHFPWLQISYCNVLKLRSFFKLFFLKSFSTLKFFLKSFLKSSSLHFLTALSATPWEKTPCGWSSSLSLINFVLSNLLTSMRLAHLFHSHVSLLWSTEDMESQTWFGLI